METGKGLSDILPVKIRHLLEALGAIRRITRPENSEKKWRLHIKNFAGLFPTDSERVGNITCLYFEVIGVAKHALQHMPRRACNIKDINANSRMMWQPIVLLDLHDLDEWSRQT